jgi:hypothetical protein
MSAPVAAHQIAPPRRAARLGPAVQRTAQTPTAVRPRISQLQTAAGNLTIHRVLRATERVQRLCPECEEENANEEE